MAKLMCPITSSHLLLNSLSSDFLPSYSKKKIAFLKVTNDFHFAKSKDLFLILIFYLTDHFPNFIDT